MRRSTPAMLGLAVLLLTGGCFRHTFVAGAGAPDGRLIYNHWHHHWIFGLIGEEPIQLAELCPSGNATIHEETSFLNGLIAALIGIIYSPTTVTVRCDDGRMSEIELDAEQVSRIVHDPGFLAWVERDAPWRLEEVRMALARADADRDVVATGLRTAESGELHAAR